MFLYLNNKKCEMKSIQKVRKNLTAQQHYSVLQSQFVVYTVKIRYRLKYVKTHHKQKP